MPIKYLQRKDIDISKYNACLDNSKESLLYGYSWYLDIVCDQWDCLVLDDYVAVMPIPWRKKYFIKYVYPPLWLLQLGVFSSKEHLSEIEFITELESRFKFIELRLNASYYNEKLIPKCRDNQFQVLDLNISHQIISKKFNRNRKRELKKASQYFLSEKWNDDPKNLILLFKNNVGKRLNNIQDKDYENLQRLMDSSIAKGVGELLSIYDKEDRLVASGFFLFHKGKVTELVCSTDFSNRDNGANTFLIDRAIFKYQNKYDVFNFGGSSMETIAKYYKSFGAKTIQYPFLKVNKLPFFLRLLKA